MIKNFSRYLELEMLDKRAKLLYAKRKKKEEKMSKPINEKF